MSTSAYEDHHEHLQDALKRLILLLRLAVLRLRKTNFTEYTGLLISEEEISEIFNSSDKHKESNEPEIQKLTNYIDQLQTQISERAAASLKKGLFLPFYQLGFLFHLTPFELDTILICLGLELDLKYEKLYAYLQDDVTKKSPTVGLVLNLLCSSGKEKLGARRFFSPEAPLFRYSLLEFLDNQEEKQKSILAKFLKVDQRIVNFVLGFNQLDSRVNSFARIIQPRISWQDIIFPEKLKKRLSSVTKKYLSGQKKPGEKLIYHFFGPYGVGKKSVAQALCQELNLPLTIIDIKKMLCDELAFKKTLQVAFREAILQGAAIYLEHFDHLSEDEKEEVSYQNAIIEFIEEYSELTFLASEKFYQFPEIFKKHLLMNIEFSKPSYKERRSLWQGLLSGKKNSSRDIDLLAIANKFQFTGGQIQDAVAGARNIALIQGGDNGQITMDELYQSSRAESNQKLSSMAQKIIPKYSWQDIILPSDKLQQLKEICSCVKYRHIVYDKWGFDRKLSLGKGLNILFAGPSGTGKTMAAEIIAGELNIDLYKIDLSTVVSKYVGETEKNLSQIFKEAETSNAILFFDEADALFGKRSEVHDSHDRYANIEIAYLLQKMEEYNGMTILATNLSKNIDEAFLRRMHFSVELLFPNKEYRRQIWQITFPKETPRSGDIDLEFLAKRFNITGGNIRNIILSGAFLAAEDGPVIKMEHLIRATKREFQKMGKLCVESDFGKYYDLAK